MKAVQCSVLVFVLALGAGPVLAQPPPAWGPGGGPGYLGGPMGPGARVWLDVETQSERGVYIVAIRYLGIAPEELKIAQEGRDLRIYIEREAQQEGPRGRAFSTSRMSRSVSLPADADFAQMQRQEGPGFVTLWVPRRMMMGPGPRW
jgi:hypothetical protein